LQREEIPYTVWRDSGGLVGCSVNPTKTPSLLSPFAIVKVTPHAMKETTAPVSVLVKLPCLPSKLNQKLLSLSLENGRFTRNGERSEKQKAKTSFNEQLCTPTPDTFGAAPASTSIVRQRAGSRGSPLVLGSVTPRLLSSTTMNSPKSPALSDEVFKTECLCDEFSGSNQGMRCRKRLPKNLQQCRHQ
jgi:hypothetical protein